MAIKQKGEVMRTIRSFARTILYFVLLVSTRFSECWTVRVINATDEKITVDIRSTQSYPGLKSGRPTIKNCEFIGKQVDPNSSYDFDYRDVSPICVAPCTKSVTLTSPVRLTSKNKLTSCSNVIATVHKDESNTWHIEYRDWITDNAKLLEERTTMPAEVRNIYDQFSDSPIQAISVFRQPIMSGIRELITVITKNELKRLNYDQLYHTGLIIKCQNQLIRLERDQTITSTIHIMKQSEMQNIELKDIALPRTIRYDEFINNAMKDDANFWRYHPITNNCQLFVLQCLEKNNIEVSDDLRAFIYQDAAQVLANSPFLKEVSIKVTSLANRIGKITEGSSYVTIQNGTPYTIRVKTRYAGESALFNSCLPDDFLLKSGSERSVSHGICLLEGIKVAVSLKDAETIKAIPHQHLQKTADIFAEKSFVGKGKASANFLIQSVEGKKITLENKRLSATALQKLAASARTNPKLNLNLEEVSELVPVSQPGNGYKE